MENVANIAKTMYQDNGNWSDEVVSTPAGLVPKDKLKEACKLIGMIPDSWESPTTTGWSIAPDTEAEKEKYKEMINAADAREGWDMPYLGIVPPSTVLKYQIESLIYEGYRRKFGMCSVAFDNYKFNRSPEIKNSITKRMLDDNTQAKKSGASEKEIKRDKARKALSKKFQFLNG